MSKKKERFQAFRNALTLGKFLPVIGSDALDHIAAQEVKPLENLPGARLGALASQFAGNREAACPLYPAVTIAPSWLMSITVSISQCPHSSRDSTVLIQRPARPHI